MLFLGLDIGTTGAKAVVTDRQGRVLGKGYREYELSFPEDGFVEQNAEDWWTAAVAAVRQAAAAAGDPSAIRGIGLSTQGATMLAVDACGKPLAPAVTWMDTRSAAQASELAETLGAEEIYRKSGWQVSPTCDAAKILWMRRHQPEVFANAACLVSTLEFMNRRLCGRFVIDPTNAAIRQMLDIHTGRWDPSILEAIGITAGRLPEVQPIGSAVGRRRPARPRNWGFRRMCRCSTGRTTSIAPRWGRAR